MVRGRRVRAVVTYARNDDCCSPHPKRKDQRLDVGRKLAHEILSPGKTQTITQFFQAVGVDIDYGKQIVVEQISLEEPKDEIAGRVKKKNGERTVRMKETEGTFERTIDLNQTPLLQETKHCDILSPSTPHRIELCADTENLQIANGNDEQLTLDKSTPPARTGRRLDYEERANDTTQKGANNHKLTEYFPVRRSVRKTKKTVLEERQRSLERALRSQKEVGLKVCNFDGKGRGVVATRVFHKGDFVVEYSGDLVDYNEAKRREQGYAEDQNTGCYMYYFKHKSQQYCVDATAESGRLGRLVNHSRNGNLLTRTVIVDNKPRLVLIAKDTIDVGEEITYDYGDRSKESLKHHPWLAF